MNTLLNRSPNLSPIQTTFPASIPLKSFLPQLKTPFNKPAQTIPTPHAGTKTPHGGIKTASNKNRAASTIDFSVGSTRGDSTISMKTPKRSKIDTIKYELNLIRRPGIQKIGEKVVKKN
jgi:hypothetical protein